MLNNINNDTNTASRLTHQNSLNNILGTNSRNGSHKNNAVDSNFLIDSSDISNRAMKLYERELDIKKFTQLATSNPENESHNKMVEDLFSKGIVDVFEDNMIASLSDNESLLKDLGL